MLAKKETPALKNAGFAWIYPHYALNLFRILILPPKIISKIYDSLIKIGRKKMTYSINAYQKKGNLPRPTWDLLTNN